MLLVVGLVVILVVVLVTVQERVVVVIVLVGVVVWTTYDNTKKDRGLKGNIYTNTSGEMRSTFNKYCT